MDEFEYVMQTLPAPGFNYGVKVRVPGKVIMRSFGDKAAAVRFVRQWCNDGEAVNSITCYGFDLADCVEGSKK